jgi:GNAT superfamily N-acetyltransferase
MGTVKSLIRRKKHLRLDDNQITLIHDSQIMPAGIVLAEAFFADPFYQYAFPDPEERRRLLPWYLTASIREGFLLNSVYTTSGQVKGVAVWTPPGFQERTPERARQSGLDQMSTQFGLDAYHRFTSVIDHLAIFSAQVIPQTHWYLSLIGVSPTSQGQGIGGALFAPVLQQADNEGIVCFLETFEAKNLSFYRRHAFQVAATGIEPLSQLRFWTMRRDPRTNS